MKIETDNLADFGLEEPDDPEYLEEPVGPECVVCGAPITYAGRGPQPKYCEAHKKPSSRKSPAEPGEPTGTVTTKRPTPTRRPRADSNKRKATEEEWDRFLLIVLISFTWLIGRFAAGGQGLLLKPPPGMSDEALAEQADYLSMNAEEAGPIAKMMATRLTPSKFNKKYGKLVVVSLEWEEVGYALWGYGKRVGPALVTRVQRPKTRKERTNGPTGQTTGSTNGALSARDAVRLFSRPTNS